MRLVSPVRSALRRTSAVVAVPLLLVGVACAPQEEAAEEITTTESTAADPAACAADKVLTDGTLTIGTDSPAYDPWFSDNDPTNGKGFESAVAYALAEELGFTADQVTWVRVPFNSSYKPGAKKFDFDINQISITPERAAVVDFSEPYYTATQGLIALEGGPAADATTVAELKGLKLGAQTGTTSLSVIRDEVQPDTDPAVFRDTNAAKQALLNGQVDAIVADLPTALYITAVEIPKASIVGQFAPTSGEGDRFGLLFEKGNPLVTCVDDALATLRDDGTLTDLEQEWLSDTISVPVLQ